MRRGWTLGLLLGVAALGCRQDRNELDVPLIEEWRSPPHEERFNNPPEQGYRPPPVKQEFKPGMGGLGGPGGSGIGARR